MGSTLGKRGAGDPRQGSLTVTLVKARGRSSTGTVSGRADPVEDVVTLGVVEMQQRLHATRREPFGEGAGSGV